MISTEFTTNLKKLIEGDKHVAILKSCFIRIPHITHAKEYEEIDRS